jgi:hypothetical protein
MNRARIVLRQGQDCAPKGMRGSLTTMNVTRSRTPRAGPITQTGTPLRRNVIIGGRAHRPRLIRSPDPQHASRRAHLLEFVSATLQQSRFENFPKPVNVASTPAECTDSRAEGLISAGSLDHQLTDKRRLVHHRFTVTLMLSQRGHTVSQSAPLANGQPPCCLHLQGWGGGDERPYKPRRTRRNRSRPAR